MDIKKLFKRFGTDVLGVLCVILAFLLGPLPGPGGIPLLIAGLSLLSIHNEWARSLLNYVRKHSASFRTIVFPTNPNIQNLWDIVGLLLLVGWIVLLLTDTHSIVKLGSTALFTLSLIIFACNRSRIDALAKKRK